MSTTETEPKVETKKPKRTRKVGSIFAFNELMQLVADWPDNIKTREDAISAYRDLKCTGKVILLRRIGTLESTQEVIVRFK